MTVDDDTRPDAAAAEALGVPPVTTQQVSEGTTQWRVREMQLVNWGGFDAPVTVELDSHSTLISGASGSGKSTLLDAYTAVMMPSDVPFNGASNDTLGRARGLEQRSVVSYVRGQTDVTADDDGDAHAHVLRGKKAAAWGGAAIVFVDDHDRYFTAARLYYVPPTARLGGDVTVRMLTFEGHLQLRDAEPLAAEAFTPHKLKALLPGIATHDTYQSFAARLHTRLGIGANGDGDKALRLLARVQAGTQIRTVDALYKEMVLERPSTYTKADKAIEHFDHLADTYRTMQEEYAKATILARIGDHHSQLVEARATIERLGTLGVNSALTPTPLSVWVTDREAELLHVAEDEAHTEWMVAHRSHSRADEELAKADVARKRAQDEFMNAGGGRLGVLEVEIARAESDTEARSAALERLATEITVLLDGGIDLSDRAQFDVLQATATGDARDITAERKVLSEQIVGLRWDQRTLSSDRDTEKAEIARLEKSGTRITDRMDDLRRQVCERAGLSIAEAPYLAELVAVTASEREWTVAVEKVLGPAASRMLVPDHKLDDFSRAVDGLQLRGELRFDGAGMHLAEPAPADPATTAGKLDFAPSPYRGWVMNRVTAPQNNALCVRTPSELGSGGYRVTATGQTRNGRAGSLGRRAERNILGFSNDDLIAAHTSALADIEAQLTELANNKATLEGRLDTLESRHRALGILATASFPTIDVGEARNRLRDKRRARADVLAGNDPLARAAEALETAEAAYLVRAKTAGTAERDAGIRKQAWESLAARRDALTRQQDEHRAQHPELLTEDTRAWLDEQLARVVGPDNHLDIDQFGAHLASLRRSLNEASARAQTAVDRAERDLIAVFETYLTAFPTTTLTPRLAAYPDFAQILSDINEVGLPERRAKWRQTVMDWSGEHLFLLHRQMDDSIVDIDARLDPINDILRHLPFGPNDGRLQMRMRKLRRDNVITFRRRLKALSTGATVEMSDAAMEQRFRELEAFIATLRSSKDPNYDPRLSHRDDLLDVRRHVEVLAERQDTGGDTQATYTSLGSKSGGETQELVAFIVGAALRFRLGDENRERPRFAPVFLDEGFIKADAQFASRAVQAWSGLGFQLIVAAPWDKYAALEPHMSQFLLISKNQLSQRSHARTISGTERATARRGR